MRRVEIAEGVYLFRIEEATVRTFGSSGRQTLRVLSTIVDPQESDDERHKFFGRQVWHGYSLSSHYGMDLLRDLFDACGGLVCAPIAKVIPTEDLIGREFSGRADYMEVPGRSIKYLRVYPMNEGPDGQFYAPKVARAMWQAKQAEGRIVRDGKPVGTQSGRWQGDKPNVANGPGEQAELKVAAQHSIYCCCASPVAKHIKFDTFEYDKCEACGKEIQNG